MDYSYKQLTNRQKKELEGYLASWVQITRFILFCIATALFALLCRFLQQVIGISYPVWIFVTIAAAAGLYFRSKKWTGGKEFREQLKKDIIDGRCKVITVEPVHIIKFEAIEDEGENFLIRDKTGDHILFSGQYLYHLKKFPWSKFEIKESINARHFWGLTKCGDSIDINETKGQMPYTVLKQLGIFNENYMVLTAEQLELLDKI